MMVSASQVIGACKANQKAWASLAIRAASRQAARHWREPELFPDPMSNAILSIDTAGPSLGLGLAGPAGQVLAVRRDIATGHAEIVFGEIAALLAEAGLAIGDIGRLVATTGPGSFTGVRIGLAAGRGLALARGLPVIGVPSLVAASLSVAAQGPFTLAKDARRGEFYMQEFEGAGRPVGDVALVPADSVPAAALTPGDVDMPALARFGADLPAEDWPALPLYVRPADAKPQDKMRVARR
jgi:tRNA threonylcarbamoyladenosine biosynthesis protein TsaB